MSFENAFNELYNRLLRNLNGETDRATVIIIAAHLDVQLEKILRTALVPSFNSSDTVFDGPNAPLASFSNKIDFCYRMGLISEFSAKTLHIIKKIRNKFAHNIEGCTFDDNSIKSSVIEMYKLHQFDRKERDIGEIFGDSAKGKFLLSTILVMGVLEEMYHHIAHNNPMKPEWPYAWLLKSK